MKDYRIIAMVLGVWLGFLPGLAPGAETVLRCFNTNSFVQFGTPAALQLPSNSPLTIEGWMKLYAQDTRDELYCKNMARSSSAYTYLFGFIDNGTKLAAYTGSAWMSVTVSIQTGRWYHLAFSFNGTTMSYYLDGQFLGTTAFSYANNAAHAAQIGGYMAANGDFNGRVCDVRVWNTARSQAQIQTLMSNRLDGTEPGLVAYWPLTEGSGLVVGDLTGLGTTGTVVNAAWESDNDLNLIPSGQPYKPSLPLTLAQPDTGSARFTNTNRVNVAAFPVPEDCNVYQVTTNGDVASLNPSGWVSTASPPAQLVFPPPAGDTNAVLYAWFTNSSALVWLRRAKGEIYYTTVLPTPSVRATLRRERMPGSNVIIYASDLDSGSAGGDANSTTLDLFQRAAFCASDLTPGELYVTLNGYGDYPMQLGLWNEAGNGVTSAASCIVTIAPFSGSNVWTGGGISNLWEDGANWSAGVPAEDQTVWIGPGATAQLTRASAALASFTLCTGSLLRVSGWTSALEAVDLVVAGTLTHVSNTLAGTDAFGNWVPLHRIWLKGSNLTVTAEGRLDADYRGYPAAAGPGKPLVGGGYGTGGGGGHGGNGGSGFDAQSPGPEWGDPMDPWQPGSGGGNNDPSYILNDQPGGGAIRTDLTGLVTVDGVVTASGRSGSGTHGTSGAGGAIAISCRTFQGAATGLVRADAGQGNYYGGNGGGGRLAVFYNSAAQSGLPRPRVRFSTYAYPAGNRGDTFTVRAAMGTLYLPDTAFLAAAPDADVGLDGQQFWHVRLYIGSQLESWSPASLHLTNCVIGFPPGFRLTVGQDAILVADTNITPKLTGPVQSGLHLYAARTNDPFGGWLEVGRDLILGSNAWIFPHTSGSNAAIVSMSVGRHLVVSNGGGMDADEKGWLPIVSNTNGPGTGRNSSSGGGYGGLGGGALGGYTNGLINMPLNAGSPGGWYPRSSYTSSGKGGGAICLVAGGDLVLDGTFTANAGDGNYYGGTAGSGGGIFLRGRRVTGSGTLRANGGTKNSQAGSGDGAGGRIAVWEDIPDYLTARLAAGAIHRCVIVTNAHPFFTGSFSVAPGTGLAPGVPLSAAPGTVRVLIYAPVGTVLSVR